MLDPRLARWFADYAQGHQHPINRLTHKIAIPFIVFHVLAMLDWVAIAALPGGALLTLGHVGYVVAIAWYLRLNLRLGLIMAVLFAAMFPIGWVTPAWLVVTVAATGWLVQLAGHSVWEKNRPSFAKNIQHALVGPLFFVALLTRDWPVSAHATRGA